MLTDSGRENQGVDAAHRHRQGADRLPNPVRVDPQGQPRLLVPLLRCREHLAHIAREARYTQEARFTIKRRLDLCRRQAVVLLDMQHNARIDRAAASGHHQPFQGRKAHGRIDTAAPTHR